MPCLQASTFPMIGQMYWIEPEVGIDRGSCFQQDPFPEETDILRFQTSKRQRQMLDVTVKQTLSYSGDPEIFVQSLFRHLLVPYTKQSGKPSLQTSCDWVFFAHCGSAIARVIWVFDMPLSSHCLVTCGSSYTQQSANPFFSFGVCHWESFPQHCDCNTDKHTPTRPQWFWLVGLQQTFSRAAIAPQQSKENEEHFYKVPPCHVDFSSKRKISRRDNLYILPQRPLKVCACRCSSWLTDNLCISLYAGTFVCSWVFAVFMCGCVCMGAYVHYGCVCALPHVCIQTCDIWVHMSLMMHVCICMCGAALPCECLCGQLPNIAKLEFVALPIIWWTHSAQRAAKVLKLSDSLEILQLVCLDLQTKMFGGVLVCLSCWASSTLVVADLCKWPSAIHVC